MERIRRAILDAFEQGEINQSQRDWLLYVIDFKF